MCFESDHKAPHSLLHLLFFGSNDYTPTYSSFLYMNLDHTKVKWLKKKYYKYYGC